MILTKTFYASKIIRYTHVKQITGMWKVKHKNTQPNNVHKMPFTRVQASQPVQPV